MAHTLTFTANASVTVDGVSISSPYVLTQNCTIVLNQSTKYDEKILKVNGVEQPITSDNISLSNVDIDLEIVSGEVSKWETFTINYTESGGGKVVHVLTINGWSGGSMQYAVPTVNNIEKIDSDSPITLKNGDVIKVPTARATCTINGTSYASQTTTLDINNQDIALVAGGPEKTPNDGLVTINYSEPVDYIISETELTTIADSIRTKTSSSDKLTPATMAEKIKTIPIITDVSDAATLTAKLTENNIGNFYRYTGTATSDYATGAIYQVTQKAVTLIDFTINGTPYQAEEGMTWAQWCDSKYNTASPSYYINSSGNVTSVHMGGGGGSNVSTDTGHYNIVKSTDVITATAYYEGQAN